MSFKRLHNELFQRFCTLSPLLKLFFLNIEVLHLDLMGWGLIAGLPFFYFPPLLLKNDLPAEIYPTVKCTGEDVFIPWDEFLFEIGMQNYWVMICMIFPVLEILIESLAFDTCQVFYGNDFSVISVDLGRIINLENGSLLKRKFLRWKNLCYLKQFLKLFMMPQRIETLFE